MTRQPKPDVAQVITDLILEKIAAGTAPWLKPWSSTSTRPLRHNGVPYSGINTFFLWAVAESRDYASPYWMTFRQALELGAAWAGTYEDTVPVPLDAAVTFAPSGDVVLAALRAVDRGAPVAINAIHLDRIPQFNYDDLWWERSLRSVANVTRADVRDFLALVPQAGVRTQYETLPLDEAPTALERLEAGDVRGAFVLI